MEVPIAVEVILQGPVSFHSELAAEWSTKYSHRGFRQRRQIFQSALEKFAHPNQHWLDAGCGTGDLSLLARECGLSIDAVDASPEMVERCRVPASVADVRSLPFPNENFDGVLCSSVLEYVDEPESALRELHRVLKVGGHLLVSVPNAFSALRMMQQLTYRLARRPRYIEFSRNAFTGARFDALLSENGFVPVSSQTFASIVPGGEHLVVGCSLRLHVARKV